MKRSLLTLAATSLIAVSAIGTVQAGALDAVLRPTVTRIGNYATSTEGNYIPEAFSKSVILSGRYCQGLPYDAKFYHLDLVFDKIDNSGSQTKFQALAHLKISSSEIVKDPAIEERLYTVTGKYENGKIHVETANPILASDRDKTFKPTLVANLGRYISYAPKAGIKEKTHLNIEQHPSGVRCYSADLLTSEKYTKKQRKELITKIKTQQETQEQHAITPTMFFNSIPIAEKNSKKTVDKILKKLGAKYVTTTKTQNNHRQDTYNTADAIPGSDILTTTYTTHNGTDYLYILQLKIPASRPGTVEADMPVVQMRDMLLKTYGQPDEGNPSVKAAWERHDGVIILFQVNRNFDSPASAQIIYLNTKIEQS